MIVDDEKLICEWLEFCISANPACTLVGVAHNGREGLELYCREKPELVLTDIKMPVMDGLKAAQQIRRSGSRVPIIAVTAYAYDRDRQKALEAGCDEYLAKPLTGDTLRQTLHRLLAGE